MVRITPFEVEEWMNFYEQTPGVLNIAETCAASVSIDELVGLSEQKGTASPLNSSVRLTYGPITGSPALRQSIANLCNSFGEKSGAPLDPGSVIICPGAISANFLTCYSMIAPGDHVICVYPTYQQLYSVPESLGAEVTLWRLKPEKGFVPDVADLEGMLRENTKVREVSEKCVAQVF